jgi:AraC-like DNA-binding protein
MICTQRGREVVLESGLVHFATNTEPMSFTHLNSRALGLAVPRKAIGALVSNLDDRVAMPLPRQKAPLQLLEGYISALNSAPNVLFDPVLTQTAVTHVHDLIAFIVGAHRDGQEIIAERGLKAAQMQAVKTYIATHLADLDLSVTSVAVVHKLSLRYLQRLFEVEGTTFTAYVLTRRLEHAYRLLSSPARLSHTIGMIAAEVGFADIPHFNGMFKRRFGATPSDIRTNIKADH